jgi:hypothetical protein
MLASYKLHTLKEVALVPLTLILIAWAADREGTLIAGNKDIASG